MPRWLYRITTSCALASMSCSLLQFAAACKGDSPPPPAVSHSQEQPSPSTAPSPTPTGEASPLATGTAANFLNATFAVNATSLGLPVCKGDIQMQISAGLAGGTSTQLFHIPEGMINCGLLGQIDLTQILGSFSQAAAQNAGSGSPVLVQNNVIALNSLGYGVYTPARPLLPAFLSTNPEALAHLNVTEMVSINSTKEGKTATGQVSLQTIAMNSTDKPPRMQRTFRHIFDFRVQNAGFDGVDKISNMLFDRTEMKINLNPIAITYLHFQGKVADFMAASKNLGAGQSNPLAGGLSALLNKPGPLSAIFQGLVHLIDVDVVMTLVRQDGLTDSATETDPTDSGEKIGGQATQN